jgi:NAD(P)H-quinone oxidoreductase subunit 5
MEKQNACAYVDILKWIAIVLTPLLTLLLGVFTSAWLNHHRRATAKAGSLIGLASLGLAGFGVLGLMRSGPVIVRFWNTGPFEISLYYDNLSALLLLLVSFLTAVITRYSQNYLDGDPQHGRFTKWLCLTAGSVQVLVIAGNLLVFALAWSAVSFCLHKLLIFYPDRPGALLAARKKFIFSRLGDLCLWGTLILVYQKFQTWDFQELFRQANIASVTGLDGYTTISFLLVATALLKSAQFPFHSWLPDTMETPTPVSALMHAGIINGGGFLVVRLSPILVRCPSALMLLAALGAFTALFASMTMLTHASIKRALAFSTVAQMGFMMLECGLGAFSLAVLHLTAHSLYKAHAFLSSGSIVQLHRSAWVPEGRPRSHRRLLAATMLATAVVTLGSAWIVGVRVLQSPGYLFLGLVLWFSLGYMLWNLWSQFLSPLLVACGLSLAAMVALAGFSLHILFEALLTSTLPRPKAQWSWMDADLACFPLILFLGVLIFQTQLPVWSTHSLCRALYVHARNGFYFTTLANRLVAAFWPLSPISTNPAVTGANK